MSQTRARDGESLRTYRALADGQPATEQPATVPSRRQRRLQQVGPETRALQALQPTSGSPIGPEVDRLVDSLGPVREGSRRDRRRRADDREQDSGAGDPARDTDGAGSPALAQPAGLAEAARDQISVEKALAAREAIIGQAQNQVAMMEAARQDDPFSVDLETLAQQKALAQRAAVLNTRAQTVQQLAQENEQRRSQLNDPTTPHNLSIASPSGFIRVPVSVHEVPKATPTSSIHVRPMAPPRAAGSALGAMTPGIAPHDGVSPIGARSAHGLEPLDAMTAGLARVKRLQYLQYSIVGLGALALITGIIMITGVLD